MLTAFWCFCCVIRTEERFLDLGHVTNVLNDALRSNNPVVLGYQVERIALSSIVVHGLDGVKATQVEYFGAESNMTSLLQACSTSQTTILYIPQSFNYPRIDAVLVSRHRGTVPPGIVTASISANLSSSANVDPDSPNPGPVSSAGTKNRPEYVHIQFIQISVGAITPGKLANTRSVLSAESPERKLWRHAAGGSAIPIFSIRWLVSNSEVEKMQLSKNFNHSLEIVSPLSSVNAALIL